MHITSDGLSCGDAKKMLSLYYFSYDILSIVDDDVGGAEVKVKNIHIGTIKPSTNHKNLYTLEFDLPRKPVEKWKYEYFSFNRDLEPGEIAALL